MGGQLANHKAVHGQSLGWTATLITAFVGLPDQQTLSRSTLFCLSSRSTPPPILSLFPLFPFYSLKNPLVQKADLPNLASHGKPNYWLLVRCPLHPPPLRCGGLELTCAQHKRQRSQLDFPRQQAARCLLYCWRKFIQRSAPVATMVLTIALTPLL